MVITTRGGRTFDTDKDLTAPERHILQKLFVWASMASSIGQFREKKQDALSKGWNNSGPVHESSALKSITRDMEKGISERQGLCNC